MTNANDLLREIRRHNSSGLTQDMQRRIDEVLSQQAEPEPAPAQDERDQLAAEVAYYRSTLRNVLKDIRDDLVRGGLAPSWSGVAETIAIVLSDDRPAQTEQQPVAWRWMYNGEPDGPYASNFPLTDDDVVWRGLMAERPRTVQSLYAAPIAQTATQPERGGLPDELFDGHAVYQETVRHRRDSGLGVRTSPENVSDALDAVVRLIRSRRAALSAKGAAE